MAAKPTPEVGQALEAEYRETLLRKADEAIYARRAAAVQEERKIKENELSREIALEEQKKKLIDLQGENQIARQRSRARRPAGGSPAWRPRGGTGSLCRHGAAARF